MSKGRQVRGETLKKGAHHEVVKLPAGFQLAPNQRAAIWTLSGRRGPEECLAYWLSGRSNPVLTMDYGVVFEGGWAILETDGPLRNEWGEVAP